MFSVFICFSSSPLRVSLLTLSPLGTGGLSGSSRVHPRKNDIGLGLSGLVDFVQTYRYNNNKKTYIYIHSLKSNCLNVKVSVMMTGQSGLAEAIYIIKSTSGFIDLGGRVKCRKELPSRIWIVFIFLLPTNMEEHDPFWRQSASARDALAHFHVCVRECIFVGSLVILPVKPIYCG